MAAVASLFSNPAVQRFAADPVLFPAAKLSQGLGRLRSGLQSVAAGFGEALRKAMEDATQTQGFGRFIRDVLMGAPKQVTPTGARAVVNRVQDYRAWAQQNIPHTYAQFPLMAMRVARNNFRTAGIGRVSSTLASGAGATRGISGLLSGVSSGLSVGLPVVGQFVSALVGATGALVGLTVAGVHLGRQQLESQFQLSKYSGQIGLAQARMQAHEMKLSIQSAGATAGTTQALADAVMELDTELQPLKDLWTNVLNTVARVFVQYATEIVVVLKGIAKRFNIDLDKLFPKKPVGVGNWTQQIIDLARDARQKNKPRVPPDKDRRRW